MVLGAVFGLAAALGFGGSAVFARLGLRFMGTPLATLVSLFVGIVITLTLAIIFHFDAILALAPVAFVWFLISGIINFPMGRLLNYTGVSMVGVSRSAPIVGSNPLFAAVLAISFGGETITIPVLLGTVFIIGGLTLILSQK